MGQRKDGSLYLEKESLALKCITALPEDERWPSEWRCSHWGMGEMDLD